MKSYLKGFTCLMLIALSIAANGQSFKKTPGKVELQDGDTFVFIGNSITHQCLYTQYLENYFFTRYPDRKINLINAGVSGDFAGDVLIRLEDDVLAHKPKYATILIGMNDGEYVKWNDKTFGKYKSDMTALTDKLEAANIQPILLTPTFFDTRQAFKGETEFDPKEASDLHYDATLSYFGTWNAEVASRNGYGFADLHGDLTHFTRKMRQSDPDFTFIPDAIHPEEDGHLIMALSVLKGMEADPLVSEIVIDLNPDGNWTYRVTNGIIDNQQDKEISFDFLANALPWVVPEGAAMAYDLTGAGSLMSKEVIRATGLSHGQYELYINETLIGTYSHQAFASGVEIQENNNTPQYQQALAVAKLNHERNEHYISRLRNHWLLRKELWQLKHNLYVEEEEDLVEDEEEEEMEPEILTEDDKRAIEEDEKEELIFSEAIAMGHDKYLEKRFEERNTSLQRQADELLEKIYEINQPKTLRYTIKKIQ
jgi:lysophospholipase L1-like esterase